MTKQVYLFLTAPKKTKAEIVCIDEKIADLRMMMLPSAIRYDKDKVQSSPEDPMLKYIERLSELEEKRKVLLAKYMGEQDAVTYAIDTIVDVYTKQVMTMRYVSCKRWDEIIPQMPFAERSVFYFHKHGLQSIESYLKSLQ